jgi:hypothetical protein
LINPGYQSCLLPTRPSGAIICQTTVTLERRRRMSLGPGDSEPSQFRGGAAAGFPPVAPASKATSGQAYSGSVNSPSITASQFTSSHIASGQVTFDRAELGRLFGLYGRKVAAGEWRDYAIDFLKDRAVFSVFRRACEVPLYRIEKNPRLARRQGTYSLISATGLIIRRGQELDRVLRALEKSLSVVTG